MPQSHSPIVVGTDGSPHAEVAVAWAADEAARRQRPLHIVHAVERWPYDIPFTSPPGIRDSLTQHGNAILAAAEPIVHQRRPELTVTTELVMETAPFALRELSRRAFEVVLGHRGLGGFASLLLGSTGLNVAGYATGPVVIVRGETETETDTDTETDTGVGAGHGEVVVGVDLYADNTAMLDYAFGAASVRGARLRAVHAFQLAENLFAAGDIDEIEQIERGQHTRMIEILAPWRERFPQVKVSEEVIGQHPVTALSAASRKADLLVVAACGHGALQGAVLGSVSHGAIHHAHCPVAVIRPHA